MVNHVDEIIQQFLDKDPKVLPGWVNENEDVIVCELSGFPGGM